MTAARRRAAGDDVRRGGGPRRVPALLSRLLDAPARRRGLVDARLITDWGAIVGPELAARCQPIKLGRDRDGTGGALHLRVGGAAALELQHSAPQVIERINTYFGHPAVARLRLVQAPLARRAIPGPAPRPALSPNDRAEVDRAVASIGDPSLREALAALGRAMRTTTSSSGVGRTGRSFSSG